MKSSTASPVATGPANRIPWAIGGALERRSASFHTTSPSKARPPWRVWSSNRRCVDGGRISRVTRSSPPSLRFFTCPRPSLPSGPQKRAGRPKGRRGCWRRVRPSAGRGLDGGRQSQRSLEWPGQARPARRAAECFSVPLLDGGDQCSHLVLVERLRGAAHVTRQRDCCHGAAHKQQGPGRTAGSRTQGLACRKAGASRILLDWSSAVVTYTPLRARPARSQGKYLYTWWPCRDSNPSFSLESATW